MSTDDDRFVPVPVPVGDGRYDIGDDARLAIFEQLLHDWRFEEGVLTPEKKRQLAMLAAASVRAVLHEIGTLGAMHQPAPAQETERGR